mgnify:CR=1 FL=1
MVATMEQITEQMIKMSRAMQELEARVGARKAAGGEKEAVLKHLQQMLAAERFNIPERIG